MKSFFFLIITLALSVPASANHVDDDIKPALMEVEQVLDHYRNWLNTPAMKYVVKGTNHAARATLLIEQYLLSYGEAALPPQPRERIGLKRIRSVLLKQMRLHVELLSTTVPEAIANYDSTVKETLAEQLDLLEKTLREFERYES